MRVRKVQGLLDGRPRAGKVQGAAAPLTRGLQAKRMRRELRRPSVGMLSARAREVGAKGRHEARRSTPNDPATGASLRTSGGRRCLCMGPPQSSSRVLRYIFGALLARF